MITQTRFENTAEFRPIWETLPAGTIAWKVKTYNGNGDLIGIEYTLIKDDLQDMKEVAPGYFTETFKLTK